jgi:hypothetical protein
LVAAYTVYGYVCRHLAFSADVEDDELDEPLGVVIDRFLKMKYHKGQKVER